MKKRRLLAMIALLLAALTLAFPLQRVVQKVVLKPLLYLFWGLGIIYRSLPQFWIWIVFLAIIFFILLTPFLEDRPRWQSRLKKSAPRRGPIETLAETLKHSGRGFYFKWVIANRLGKIVRNWVAYRERLDQRWQANDLERHGWRAPDDIRNYLDIGLNGSFADYPRSRIPFVNHRRATPLDIDPNLVLDFLESQMEKESGQ